MEIVPQMRVVWVICSTVGDTRDFRIFLIFFRVNLVEVVLKGRRRMRGGGGRSYHNRQLFDRGISEAEPIKYQHNSSLGMQANR